MADAPDSKERKLSFGDIMANWCNARLVRIGRRPDVLKFSEQARRRPGSCFPTLTRRAIMLTASAGFASKKR